MVVGSKRPVRSVRGAARAVAETDADPVLQSAFFAAYLRGLKSAESPAEAATRLLERDGVSAGVPSLREAGGANVASVLARIDRGRLLEGLGRQHAGVRPELLAHELVIAAGAPERRAQRGVYTTPDALANEVVRRVDGALRTELGLERGLVDDAVLRVLEPAAGSGAFLVALVRRMRAGFGRDERAWRAFVRDVLPRRVVACELLAPARAVARLVLGWTLRELGAHDFELDLRDASGLEVDEPFDVVLGNPPFSVRSANLDEASRALVDPYRVARGEPVVERGALRLEMHLQDDYVKFVRVAQRAVERAGRGVVGLVTNRSFLDAPTLRGMRASLAETFDGIDVLDLGGARHDGGGNVFGIAQGVCATVATRRGAGEACAVRHARFEGDRDAKLAALEAAGSFATTTGSSVAVVVTPSAPNWLFVPTDAELEAEYAAFVSVRDLFRESVSGIVTAHDALVVDFDDGPLLERADLLLDPSLDDEQVRELLAVRDNAGWKLARARERFRADPATRDSCRDFAYRPFDRRRILYQRDLVWCDRRRLMGHFGGANDLALALCRQLLAPPFQHAFVTRDLMDDNFVSNRSRERTHFFPRHVRDADGERRCNLVPEAVQRLLPAGAEPDDVVAYVYAVLHEPGYRARYAPCLRFDFPRIPRAANARLLREFVRIGERLIALHLGESEPASLPDVTLDRGSVRVQRGEPRFDGESVAVTGARFGPIDPATWEFGVGAYAPCRKFLADRVGRELDAEELAAYRRLVGALDETRRLQLQLANAAESAG